MRCVVEAEVRNSVSDPLKRRKAATIKTLMIKDANKQTR